MYIFKNMDTLSDDDVEFDSKPMEKDIQDKKNPLKFLQYMTISCVCSNSLCGRDLCKLCLLFI